DPGLAGAAEPLAEVHHSMPRYWSPLYLVAVVAPILFLASCRRRAVLLVGSLCVCALALGNAYELVVRQQFSLVALRAFERDATGTIRQLERKVPSQAMVYSSAHDKILWAHWRVGTVDEPKPTAASMKRAVDAGLDVFMFDPSSKQRRQGPQLERALKRHQLKLVKAKPRGLYHVAREDS